MAIIITFTGPFRSRFDSTYSVASSLSLLLYIQQRHPFQVSLVLSFYIDSDSSIGSLPRALFLRRTPFHLDKALLNHATIKIAFCLPHHVSRQLLVNQTVDMSATIPSDLPGQPSSSSTFVPIHPVSTQTTALSADFLENLLMRAITAAGVVSSSGTQAIGQPSVAASAAEFATPPPFVAASATVLPLGTSLFDRFPQVEESTILEIIRHDFKPMDLFKLDPAALDVGGSLHNFPTFSSLLEPLLIYFSILTAYAASSGDMLATLTIANGCNAYTGHLSALNRRFQWNAVLQYHKSYFLSRRREMTRGNYTGWLQPDILLMNEHLFRHLRIQNHPNLSKNSRLASNSAKQPVATQTCFAFNKGSCTSSPCPKSRIHRCQNCNASDHGASNCSKLT